MCQEALAVCQDTGFGPIHIQWGDKNAHVHTTITPPQKVINNLDTESSGKTTRNFFLLRITL
jgi:hypothetical protein